MTIHRFYVPPAQWHGSSACLSSSQSHQVTRVVRLRSGDEIIVFDGSGPEHRGILAELVDGCWQIRIGEAVLPDREPRIKLIVGLSLIRNERFDLAVQKLTEVGVAEIVPISANRSVIIYDDARRWNKRRTRLERIVVEAAEQSERTTLLTIHDPQTVNDFLTRHATTGVVALVERQDRNLLTQSGADRERIALLVGPEGGWTDDELQLIDVQAQTLSLGGLIMRSETAAIVAAGYVIFSHDRNETTS